MEELRHAAFEKTFGRPARWVFSAPGRTELSGNHTDHQHGRVLAAAVNLDTRASVALNGTDEIRFLSEGYPLCRVGARFARAPARGRRHDRRAHPRRRRENGRKGPAARLRRLRDLDRPARQRPVVVRRV
jgi:hypothetical protein